MATDKPRFSVSMSENMLQEVEQYRKANNIATKSKAVIRLAEIGLESIKKEAPPKQDEVRIMDVYDSLDAHGQRMVKIVAAEEQARMGGAKCPAPKKPTPPPVEVAGQAVEPDYRQMPFAAHGPVPEEYTPEQADAVERFQREVGRRKK